MILVFVCGRANAQGMGADTWSLLPPVEPVSVEPVTYEELFAAPGADTSITGALITGGEPILPGEPSAAAPCSCGPACPELTVLPHGLIYRPYLASEKESRLRSFWSYEKDERNIWDITLGGHVGILRYGSTGDDRPTGWQLDIEGAGIPRLDPNMNNELISADFRFGIPLTYGNERYQMKFGYYHLSSHLGDEFLLRNPGFPRRNFSRDVLIWGHSFYLAPTFRLYAEAGYAFASDVARQWEFQFGADMSPACETGPEGAPFAAVNASLREEVNYGGNFVVQVGWAWRRSPASGSKRGSTCYPKYCGAGRG